MILAPTMLKVAKNSQKVPKLDMNRVLVNLQKKICIPLGQPKKVLNKEFNTFKGKKLFLETTNEW